MTYPTEPLICKYCGGECLFVELQGILHKPVEMWQCNNCPNTVRYGESYDKDVGHDWRWVCISLKWNGKSYGVQFTQETLGSASREYCEIVEILPHNNETKEEDRTVLVCRLESLPNITPTNIKEKLPIYITFS